jgi:hypothetical protein
MTLTLILYCDVMVRVLALSVVDCGFDVGSNQTKYHKIVICCFYAKCAVFQWHN